MLIYKSSAQSIVLIFILVYRKFENALFENSRLHRCVPLKLTIPRTAPLSLPVATAWESAAPGSDDDLALVLLQSSVWRGHRIDLTSFINMGMRYYDPLTGRFLLCDPLAGTALRQICMATQSQ